MKLLFPPLFWAVLLALVALPVRATPLDDCIDHLKHAMQKEAEAKMNAAGVQGGFINPGFAPAAISANVDQIMTQINNANNGMNAEQQLAQLVNGFTSDEVQEAAANLLGELKKEHKEKADALIADMKTLLQRATHDIAKAKKPEDLDDLIQAMGERAGNRNGMNFPMSEDQTLNQQFNATYDVAKQWQNYLSHEATGETDLAHNDLQALTQNDTALELIPRSKLLALAAQMSPVPAPGSATPAASSTLAQAQALIDGMKTLDDMEPTFTKLEPLYKRDMGELQGPYQALSQMVLMYKSLKAGLPTQIFFSANYFNDVPADIRSQLFVLALQSRFDSFQGKLPGPTEKPMDFVNRVIADAANRQDWELLRRAEQSRSALDSSIGYGVTAADTRAVDDIIAGTHQEEAGQYALAVQSYEAALKSADPAVPAKIIGDKLAAIQRDHPKDYADGLELTESPPAPRYYQLPPSSPRQPLPPAITNTVAPIPPTLQSPAVR